MQIATFLLYLVAAGLAVFHIYRRPGWLMMIMFVFAAGLGFEEYEWFLPQVFSGTETWPARNLTQAFLLSLQGISTPTTLPELVVVSVGRLFILLTVVYGGYFVYRYWPQVVAYVRGMPPSTLSLLLLWEGCLLINFVVLAFGVAALVPLAAVLKVLGAFVCLLYMANEVYLLVRTPSSSVSPGTGA